MQKRWVLQKVDEEKVQALVAALKVHPVFCRLLVQRGVESFEEARRFFRPELSHLHDPFLMKDMQKAVDRITKAITGQEKILIYGDYDVDGTTAVSLLFSFISDFYNKVEYYIPNRYTEGYGISFEGVEYAADNDFQLIIALDCGIKALAQVEAAGQKGIDFIICDHHLPGEKVPSAVAILDPKQYDCTYPYKELSGAGLAFKLGEALCSELNIPLEKLYKFLELVAISIGCDIVPVTGENRILAFYGLKKINADPLPGVKALMEVCSLKKGITITDLVFKLGPRINAAGRMDDARWAVKLLISKTVSEASVFAAKLNSRNSRRKNLDEQITREAIEMIREVPGLADRKTTVVHHPEWHKGVIGIVASRLIEHYYRPTIVLSEKDEVLSGSARSVKGFNIYEALLACEDLLDKFGGHKYAAGMTLKRSNLEAFKERFEKVVAENIPDELLVPEMIIHTEFDFCDLNENFFRILRQFGPFGPQNMKPVFVTRQVINDQCRIVGEKHLKMRLRTTESKPIEAIAFGQGAQINQINGNKFEVCYTIEENEYMGRKNLQLNVKEIRT